MDTKLLNEMRRVVNKYDPIKIYSGKSVNFDEYDPEIRDIYFIFKKCNSLNKFTVEVHRVFKRWFDKGIAGDKKKYVQLSKDGFKL